VTENQPNDGNTPTPAPPPAGGNPQGSQFPRPTMQEIGKSADHPGAERRDGGAGR
jgi:hypothetical protein